MTIVWFIIAVAAFVVVYFVLYDTTIYRAQPIEFLERFLPTLAGTVEGSVLVIKPDSSNHVLRVLKTRLVDADHLEVTFVVEWPIEFDDQSIALQSEIVEAGLHPRWERSDSGESILKVYLSGTIPELYRQVRRFLDATSDTLEISVDDTFTFYIKGELGLDSLRLDKDRLELVAREAKSKIARRYAQRQLRKIRNDE